MPFPETSRIELPILIELKATGGADQLRYLYDRLARYFPQITSDELDGRADNGRSRWRACVQRAGRQLEERGELRRQKTCWEITTRGLKRAEIEAMQPELPPARTGRSTSAITHRDAQAMLVEIGLMLGYFAEAEIEYYDVVWRQTASAPRLSHVFEVQISGSVDSALTRLKQAFDTQRSRIFLVIADERDNTFARKRLAGSFHEIWEAVTVIGVGELKQLHEMLRTHRPLLERLVTRDKS